MLSRFLMATTLCIAAQTAMAEEAPSTVADIELNALEQVDAACRMTFTAKSAAPLDSIVVETVLFDTAGAVALLTLFDFGALPAEKMRVRQFDLAGTQCSRLGKVLFNGIESCAGPACASPALSVGSRLDAVEVLG